MPTHRRCSFKGTCQKAKFGTSTGNATPGRSSERKEISQVVDRESEDTAVDQCRHSDNLLKFQNHDSESKEQSASRQYSMWDSAASRNVIDELTSSDELFNDAALEQLSRVSLESSSEAPTIVASKLDRTVKGGSRPSKGMTRIFDRSKGLATHPPPISDCEDIFMDITKKSIASGLLKVLHHLGSQSLRVATMCSGTESPVLALELVADSLRDLGMPGLEVDHLFAVEIKPFKQEYIQRNFSVDHIFRDVVEVAQSVQDGGDMMATTMSGERIPVPGSVHVLVAGTSCVDFSALNNHKKALHAENGGESSNTWYAVHDYCKAQRPAIVVLENVKDAEWDLMMKCYENLGYEVAGALVNSRDWYCPQTRHRGYAVCFD